MDEKGEETEEVEGHRGREREVHSIEFEQREQATSTLAIQSKVSTTQMVRLEKDEIEEIVQHIHDRLHDSMKTLIRSTIIEVLNDRGHTSEPLDSRDLPFTSDPASSIDGDLRIHHVLHILSCFIVISFMCLPNPSLCFIL